MKHHHALSWVTLVAVISLVACGSEITSGLHTNTTSLGQSSEPNQTSSASSDANAPMPHLSVQSPNLVFQTSADGSGPATPLPYVVITRNPDAPNTTPPDPREYFGVYTISAYSWDPCLYEAQHGVNAEPDGGVKVEFELAATTCGCGPVLAALTYNAPDSPKFALGQIETVSTAACFKLPRVDTGTITLDGNQAYGNTTLANGSGSMNAPVAAPAGTFEGVVKGAFVAGHCVPQAQNPPEATQNANTCVDIVPLGYPLSTAVF